MVDSLKVEMKYEQTIKELGDSLNHNLVGIKTELQKSRREEKIFNRVTYDTAFTVLITISIFILGIIIDRIIKWYERKKERKKLRELYTENINSFNEKLLPKIIQHYRELYQTLNIDSGIQQSTKISTNDIERLNKIEFNKLYDAFSNKKSFSIVTDELDFILKSIIETDKYHGQFYAESKISRTVYYDLVNNYLDLLAEYLKYDRESNPDNLNDSTFILINASLLKFHQNIAGTRQLKRFYNEILRPIQLELVRTRKYDTHPIGEKITKLGKDLSLKYNEFRKEIIEVRLQYRYIYNLMKESTNRLNNAILELN